MGWAPIGLENLPKDIGGQATLLRAKVTGGETFGLICILGIGTRSGGGRVQT